MSSLLPLHSLASPPRKSLQHTHTKNNIECTCAIHCVISEVTFKMNGKEESLLFLVYFVGFAIVGVLLYISAYILDKLIKERVEQDHRDRARVEYREYEQDRDMNRFGQIFV